MFAASSFVPLVLTILFSSLESETATTAFSTSPSVPSYAVEGMNFTLEWTYTLDGSVGAAQFFNGIELIGKRFGPGNITSYPKYQARFRAQVTNTRAELTIHLVERSDQSTYRLDVVPTGLGSLTDDVPVTVHYQPSIGFISPNQTVNDSTLVWLDCEADSVPKATITWTRLSTNKTVGRPFNITGKQDQGIYRCTANNGIGNAATANVIVIVQYPVEARDSGENFTVAGGEAKRFTCPVDGNPEPNIEWYSEKTGRKISSGKELEATETGCYTCVASNSLGTPVNITQCLIVDRNLPPTTIPSQRNPVEARDSGENFTVAGGEAKRFTCPVDGNPEPNIEWYSEKTGRKISSGKELEATETGCYTCVASNSLGTPVNITQCLIVDRNLPPTTIPSQRISEDPPWIIIGVVVGVVVVMVPVIGFVTWRIRKKKKKNYRRESKHGDLHYEGVANVDSLVRTATREHQKPDSDE
ncbi:intercellular adhesion molecule 5-like isoform X3 [Acropora palmata]|uniref:intercellular adhesion molecule 5-like isoform X3 n=1 Tax=Acropora palmata TaxID=6131 RepID=UPI003DA01718